MSGQPPGTEQRPGLVSEWIRTGTWLFRKRSYAPVPLAVLILVYTAIRPRVMGGDAWTAFWLGLGLLLGALGLAIRAITVGSTPGGTSGRGTRRMQAASLNTSGAYSLVRHPLYLGNFLMWLGVAAFAGQPLALVLTALVFWPYYERIMVAEEAFLADSFPDDFARWADGTPAFFPKLRPSWRPPEHPFRPGYVFWHEYQAAYSFVVVTSVIQLARVWSEAGTWRVATLWWIYLLAGTGVFVIARTLRRR